jgi:hypothetical protein
MAKQVSQITSSPRNKPADRVLRSWLSVQTDESPMNDAIAMNSGGGFFVWIVLSSRCEACREL